MQELDEILAAEEKETPPEPSVKKTPEIKPEDLEIQKKKEQLENLNKAITEANDILRKTREAKKANSEEDEILKIDFDDPSSKAWDKHIKESVNPMQVELAKEKEEIRTFALRTFLEDKPSLASNPDKIKELMETYEKIKTASERTTEGVLIDLNKSFAAVFHEELINQVRDNRLNKVRGDILFSDPAVSRGSTSYFQERKSSPSKELSDDDRAVLAKWNMTAEEWAKMKEETDKKI